MRHRTDHLVVHGAFTTPTQDIGRRTIDAWHRERGFREIGYHLVIRRCGTLEAGRGLTDDYLDLEVKGAGVLGHNHDSVHLCLVGGADPARSNTWQNNYTDEQLRALSVILQSLELKYPDAQVVGHRDLDPDRECPGFDVAAWYESQPKPKPARGGCGCA